MPIGVACSTFGAANGSAFTAARLSYAAGSNGHFPKFISYLSQSRLTPLMAWMSKIFKSFRCKIDPQKLCNNLLIQSIAVVFNTTLSIIMIIPETSSISTLLDYFSFAMWIIYFLTFLSIIVMRFHGPMKDVEREFKVWLPLPILCALIGHGLKFYENFRKI